jgi:hypothetical protein
MKIPVPPKPWTFLCLIPAACLLFSFAAFALDWPVKEAILLSNFGSNDLGNPVTGDSFESESSVFPADVGELIFYQDPSNKASRLPSPLGSWMALEHGDGLIGIYSRFEDRKGSPLHTIVEKETPLALSGKSGWTVRKGFSFFLFDRKERCWINPSILIAHLEDDKPPVIRQVELRSAAGTAYNPGPGRSIPQGVYSLYVDAADTITRSGEILAPSRISCSINGAEMGELKFETLISKNGKHMVSRNGLTAASQVYGSYPFYNLGEIQLTRGQVLLVIEAEDIERNNRAVTYRLTID